MLDAIYFCISRIPLNTNCSIIFYLWTNQKYVPVKKSDKHAVVWIEKDPICILSPFPLSKHLLQLRPNEKDLMDWERECDRSGLICKVLQFTLPSYLSNLVFCSFRSFCTSKGVCGTDVICSLSLNQNWVKNYELCNEHKFLNEINFLLNVFL